MAREPDAWSAPYRVRFDEAAPDGQLRTSVLLRYAQDIAWFHSAARGFDRAWYAERGLAWLVRTAEVAVLAPVAVGSEIVGTTRVVGWRRVWARRRTEFRDAPGSLLAWTQIDWVLLDARGAPTRIPAEFEPVFGATSGAFALARVPLADAPSDALRATITVRPHELDPMDHVNNAVYADWLEEAVTHAGGGAACHAIPRFLRLEYAAPVGAAAHPNAETWSDPLGWSYRLRDGPTELLRGRLEPVVPHPEPLQTRTGERLAGALAERGQDERSASP